MERLLPPVRSLTLAIGRCLASIISASAILLTSAVAQAQEPDEGGEDVLVLNRSLCGEKYHDTPRMSECLVRQNAKADRWMAAIGESHVQWGAKDMADLTEMGGHPFDVVAQLRKSRAAFELYRKEASEWDEQRQFGMNTALFSAATYFDLTVDRARFLLGRCYSSLSSKLTDQIDLSIADWCSFGR